MGRKEQLRKIRKDVFGKDDQAPMYGMLECGSWRCIGLKALYKQLKNEKNPKLRQAYQKYIREQKELIKEKAKETAQAENQTPTPEGT